MPRIAHLSDLHLLEEGWRARRGKDRLRLDYLSFWRPLDAAGRLARARAALASARTADHLVLTGDLTEDGSTAQFEVVRGLLLESGIPAERITLVPGNHDAYGEGWEAALSGPLDRWAATSRPGTVTRLRGASVVAVSSAVRQSVLRSSGRIHDEQLAGGAEVARRSPGEAVLFAQHHPPFTVTHHWVHGLVNHADVRALLDAHANVSVLHGHTHRRRDRGIGAEARVFSTEAVAETDGSLRLYDVDGPRLIPVEAAAPSTLPADWVAAWCSPVRAAQRGPDAAPGLASAA